MMNKLKNEHRDTVFDGQFNNKIQPITQETTFQKMMISKKIKTNLKFLQEKEFERLQKAVDFRIITLKARLFFILKIGLTERKEKIKKANNYRDKNMRSKVLLLFYHLHTIPYLESKGLLPRNE